MFRLTITRLQPARAVEVHETEAAHDVAARVEAIRDDSCIVFVEYLRDGVDLGDFLLWRHAGRAFVRLDEHRSHFATDGVLAATDRVWFLNEEGDSFWVPGHDTSDAQLGIEALLHWLRTGRKTPALQWR